MFNYPREYVQLPWGVSATTLGSMFKYHVVYVQVPWGVCSTTLRSMFNYPGEYFQIPWGEIIGDLAEISGDERRLVEI